MRPTAILVLLATAPLLVACGQEDSPGEAARRVAPLALTEARGQLAPPRTPPWLRVDVLDTELAPGVRAARVGEKQRGLQDSQPTQVRARLAGRLRTRVRIRARPDLASALRVPETGTTLERPFVARAARDGQSWTLAQIDRPVDLGAAAAAAPSRGERAAAERRARSAVRDLLTFRGDRRAYAAAQERHYLTRRGRPAGGGPGLDAPPRLAELSDRGSAPEPLGTAWPRTADPDDDLALGEVMPLTTSVPRRVLCGDRIRLRRMRPKSGSLRTSVRDGGPSAAAEGRALDLDPGRPRAERATQELRVDGALVVVTGDWRCEGPTGAPVDVGPDDVRVRFRATLTRVALGDVRTPWLVSGLRLRRGGVDAGPSPVLYATDLRR